MKRILLILACSALVFTLSAGFSMAAEAGKDDTKQEETTKQGTAKKDEDAKKDEAAKPESSTDKAKAKGNDLDS
jgi:hypothetical protein